MDDITSLRGLYFFAVPIVKLYSHLLSHLSYTGLLLWGSLLNLDMDGHVPPGVHTWEYCFWGFTFARSTNLVRGRANSDQKKLSIGQFADVLSLVLVAAIMCIRLSVQREVFGPSSFGDMLDDGRDFTAHRLSSTQADLLQVAHLTYGLLNCLEWLRILQYWVNVSERLGVLIIVLFQMLKDDVLVFLVLFGTFFGGDSPPLEPAPRPACRCRPPCSHRAPPRRFQRVPRVHRAQRANPARKRDPLLFDAGLPAALGPRE